MPAFKITIECRNCGDEWEREADAGTKVDDRAFGGVNIYNEDHSECDCCGRVECRTCELERHLTITNREPTQLPA